MKINIANRFFPSYCVICKRVGESICSSCIRNKIFVNWDTYCCVCNTKVKLGLIHKECEEQTYLNGHFFVTTYNEGVKELVMQGKYSYNFTNFNFIGNLMSKFLKLYPLNQKLLLVPVPLTVRKKRNRGFNQSEVIAKEITKNTKYQSAELINKVRNVSAQAELSGEERRVNLKDSFKVNQSIAEKVSMDTPILLIDDVFTTGSTLNECARTLKDHGFKFVYGYTFAKAGKV